MKTKKLKGREAISAKEKDYRIVLEKSPDPTEGYLYDISINKAQAVLGWGDGSELIFTKEMYVVEFEKVEYILTKVAAISDDGNHYYASAIKNDLNDYGEYRVVWDCINRDVEDESDACDWEDVVSVDYLGQLPMVVEQ
jgi:hypothetical protein